MSRAVTTRYDNEFQNVGSEGESVLSMDFEKQFINLVSVLTM